LRQQIQGNEFEVTGSEDAFAASASEPVIGLDRGTSVLLSVFMMMAVVAALATQAL
jgi:hypothetical protein